MTQPALSIALRAQRPGFDLDVDFTAPAGLTVLFGASGSGKTSIVDAVAGLTRDVSGRIAVGDQVLLDSTQGICLPAHERRIGYVFQDARLFPHLTVRRNLDYARRVTRQPVDVSRFDKVVEMLGIAHLLDRRTPRLSGGEKQRLAIGRALLSRPQLILADEPLAALDAPRKDEILPYFERLRDEGEVPILYVTHSTSEVARLATTVVALDRGRVVRQGDAIEVLGDPSFSPGDVRSVGAVIKARVAAHHDDGLTELDAGGIPLFLPRIARDPGAQVRVRIAAQDVILSRGRPEAISALNCLPGVVQEVQEGAGPGAILSLDTAAGRVLARITKRSLAAMDLSVGTELYAIVKTVAVAPSDVGGPKG
ncbi:molybdate transport system ATP-binding protein [Aliiroseovarius halocynthiae]|uniref:Molybdenum ABC transporter ATP-binding protein n=1 Tax=Aliiroseovarius halocynthiae TaxID=985055 RepID=A0A545SR45_9RHOB|nr:molybdenum ABC transporter ATP-binding protein [Aliiroseovarius halocynthiae]TQV67429.1 molybdenum ABC transporter ATP-binding protein [Aliiroseovarius halocynthiae]SMR81427.1 molybdate transport system ATP-binding protein [Aliiroseovarius halocynthiae]